MIAKTRAEALQIAFIPELPEEARSGGRDGQVFWLRRIVDKHRLLPAESLLDVIDREAPSILDFWDRGALEDIGQEIDRFRARENGTIPMIALCAVNPAISGRLAAGYLKNIEEPKLIHRLFFLHNPEAFSVIASESEIFGTSTRTAKPITMASAWIDWLTRDLSTIMNSPEFEDAMMDKRKIVRTFRAIATILSTTRKPSVARSLNTAIDRIEEDYFRGQMSEDQAVALLRSVRPLDEDEPNINVLGLSMMFASKVKSNGWLSRSVIFNWLIDLEPYADFLTRAAQVMSWIRLFEQALEIPPQTYLFDRIL